MRPKSSRRSLQPGGLGKPAAQPPPPPHSTWRTALQVSLLLFGPRFVLTSTLASARTATMVGIVLAGDHSGFSHSPLLCHNCLQTRRSVLFLRTRIACTASKGARTVKTEYMREFIHTAKTLALRESARELFVSPAASSAHIKAIESELGAELFEQAPNGGLALTKLGMIFLGKVEGVVRSYDVMMEECAALSSEIPAACSSWCSASCSPASSPSLRP